MVLHIQYIKQNKSKCIIKILERIDLKLSIGQIHFQTFNYYLFYCPIINKSNCKQ